MRRIIERVVTVVTTTTWKISWENDPPPAQPAVDPASQHLARLETLPESIPSGFTVIETKEVYPYETEETKNYSTAGLPEDPNSHRSKKGNENNEHETY